MKKKDLKNLAWLGLMSGLVVGCNNSGDQKKENQAGVAGIPTAEVHQQHLMSEEDLLSQLNEQAKALYYSLDEEGKALAIRVVSTTCAGNNECRGLNVCKGATNDCAGLGDCKGQSKCGIPDKNLAIKLVVKHMAQKRAQLDY
jgi:hypothetical protein